MGNHPNGFFKTRIINFSNTIMKFLKHVQAEMSKVVWPDANTTATYTFIVIVISLFVAYYLGFFDFIFQEYGLRALIR